MQQCIYKVILCVINMINSVRQIKWKKPKQLLSVLVMGHEDVVLCDVSIYNLMYQATH